MAQIQISTKRIAISKANAQMVVIVAVAAFVSVFCLVAAKAIWSQTHYQAKVIHKDEIAVVQLKKNLTAFDDLVTSYNAFVAAPNNVIGGNSSGKGDKDGDNAQIILDALPSTYDFPALTSSLEKIINAGGYKVGSISGTDDQVNQQSNTTSNNPQAVPMPFTFGINDANYTSVQQLITTLQQSIRPIQIDTMNLSGSNSNMTLSLTAHTYYQPGKSVSITKQVVK